MLWNLIRDFFVMHVFGGTTSTLDDIRVFGGNVDIFFNGQYQSSGNLSNYSIFPIGTDGEGLKYQMLLGDWLSTTATIISISIIVIMCCLFIYKIIRLIGGLIR